MDYIGIMLAVVMVMLSLRARPCIAGDTEQLEQTFKKGSQEEYVGFLEKWEAYPAPLTKQEVERKLDFEQHVYAIYQLFYRPKHLGQLANPHGREMPTPLAMPQWGEIYQDIAYVLIQNSVHVYFAEDIHWDAEWGYRYPEVYSKLQILDFKPAIQVEGSKIIYLTPDHRESLTRFLGDEAVGVGADGFIMSPGHAVGLSRVKQTFLEQQIRIFRGHWGNGWHIETHPYVQNIIFNRAMTSALLHFKLVYQGGEAYFTRTNSAWKLLTRISVGLNRRTATRGIIGIDAFYRECCSKKSGSPS